MRYLGKISVSSGPLSGKTYDVNGDIILGRATESGVVFPNGESNISRKHCLISYDANADMFYVTDLSSNGTFMNNDIKLQSGVRTAVPVGTSIYLGTRNNAVMLMHVPVVAEQAKPEPKMAQPVNNPVVQAAKGPSADEVKKAKNYSVAALILGITGLIGGWFPVIQYFTSVAAVLAVIFGVMGRKRSKSVGSSAAMATWGMVMGIIGVVVMVVSLIISLVYYGAALSLLGSMF